MVIYGMSKITRKGYEELLEKKRKLTEDLKRYQTELAIARSDGDLKENGPYQISKESIREVNKELAAIMESINSAVIVESSNENSNTIQFGTSFVGTIKSAFATISTQEKTYKIVGEAEANFFDGLINEKSELGLNLIGKKPGDVVKVGDKVEITITQIL